MRFFAMFVSVFIVTPVLADTVVATRTIRAHSVLSAQDLAIKPVTMIGSGASHRDGSPDCPLCGASDP